VRNIWPYWPKLGHEGVLRSLGMKIIRRSCPLAMVTLLDMMEIQGY